MELHKVENNSNCLVYQLEPEECLIYSTSTRKYCKEIADLLSYQYYCLAKEDILHGCNYKCGSVHG